MKPKNAAKTMEALNEILDSFPDAECDALFYDADEMLINEREAEENPDELASAEITVRIFAEPDPSLRFSELNARVEKQAHQIISLAKKSGIELVEQKGEILLKGGGIQINLNVK